MATSLKRTTKAKSKKSLQPPPVKKMPADAPPPAWQTIVDLGARIPAKEWKAVPTDGAKNYKHYLHGGPRQK